MSGPGWVVSMMSGRLQPTCQSSELMFHEESSRTAGTADEIALSPETIRHRGVARAVRSDGTMTALSPRRTNADAVPSCRDSVAYSWALRARE